ncbi:sigma-70 family RNA polymerase sigma factor [Stutzerimonas kirkiae]|uniref:RNA polymerase subunit sigma n=1 Tax=Stutzerimonas kirkiae TaxID=2211392 RepID=A0A4Q9REL0_9GAMM|nr:sigma-70 family RNA polymerase sigma factor [Stutzerimonas kirkiae]TBU99269.1 RNA polymerase subunit sigma [Stutzerimonas kirkiae]TBV06271.1 RNA polymerase subunit sigma [Stutzerimonas kirkiae]TBV08015.1 RNA polymerase subunit sigma [Stutzerimonas kirkiae]
MPQPDPSQQRALQQLYEQHNDWLRSWIRKRMDCSEQAADLTHDTFLQVLLRRKAIELREPHAYLSSIARSLLIDRFRRRALERAYLEALASHPETLQPSPENHSLVIEALLEIDGMLDELGPRGREIFLMAQLDGMSFVSIGQRLGISTNTVRKHFVRAMARCLLLIED